MARKENGTSAGAVFLSFLAGAVVGAGTALLATPKTGKEMRGELSDFTDSAVARIRTYANEAQTKFNALLEEGREQMREKESAISSTTPETREMGWERQKREPGIDVARNI